MFPCNLSRKRNNLQNWLMPGLCKCRNKSNFQFWDLEPLTHECVLLASWWVLQPLSLSLCDLGDLCPPPPHRKKRRRGMHVNCAPPSLPQSERPSSVHVPMMMTEERRRRENTYMYLRAHTCWLLQESITVSPGYMVFGYMVFSAIWSDFCWSHLLMVTK